MTFTNTAIEDTLKNILQKKISLEIDKKVYKTGKLLLFTQHYFFITLILHTAKKKQEKVEIPIPFNIEVHSNDNLIYFDYRISTLAHNNKEAQAVLQSLLTKKNKFIDKILTVIINNE